MDSPAAVHRHRSSELSLSQDASRISGLAYLAVSGVIRTSPGLGGFNAYPDLSDSHDNGLRSAGVSCALKGPQGLKRLARLSGVLVGDRGGALLNLLVQHLTLSPAHLGFNGQKGSL